ncbi:MAG: hypothetical protein WCK08_00980 [Betaproteobacteria bacterium]
MATIARKTPAATRTSTRSAARKTVAATAKPAAKRKPAAKTKPEPAPVATASPAPSADPAAPAQQVASKAEKAEKAKKPKLVRDSFTIPKAEYTVIDTLKQRAAMMAMTPKKSELLRAGLMLLAGLGDAALAKALTAVPTIKTGRPKG